MKLGALGLKVNTPAGGGIWYETEGVAMFVNDFEALVWSRVGLERGPCPEVRFRDDALSIPRRLAQVITSLPVSDRNSLIGRTFLHRLQVFDGVRFP